MNELQRARAALEGVIDPELGIDIVSLGLVYGIAVFGGEVNVEMTTTSEMCPMGDVLMASARDALRREFPGRMVSVDLKAEPVWQVGMMDVRARRAVGLL